MKQFRAQWFALMHMKLALLRTHERWQGTPSLANKKSKDMHKKHSHQIHKVLGLNKNKSMLKSRHITSDQL